MNIKQLTEEVEKVSQKYTTSYHIARDDDWFILKLQEELGELIQSYLMMKGKGRTKGLTKKEIKENFEAEVADVLAHILLVVKHYDIDLEKAIEKKWLSWNR